MLENFDYVTMENYSADMAESTARATSIIVQLRKRAEMAERVIAEIIIAAGGAVKVSELDLHDPQRPLLEMWRNAADLTIEYRARRELGEGA